MDKIFEIMYDERSGGISLLKNKNDEFSMNWVEGSAVWGTVKDSVIEFFEVTKTGMKAEFSHKKFKITVERSLVDNKLKESYTFTNKYSYPVFAGKGEVGIYTTFNDSYDSADICMTNRCNTHIWCGENTAWVNALKMGVSDINLGLVLTKGSIDCYSIERDIEKVSNDRGDFILHPSAFSLEPDESYTLEWELFFHTGADDFDKKLSEYKIIIPKAKHYTVFESENIDISINTASKIMLDNEIIAENVKELSYKPNRLGEHNFIIESNDKRTNIRIYVSSDIDKLVKQRVHYIAENQQYHNRKSVLDGAYLIFDTKEKSKFFDNNHADHNASRERIGMALLIAEYLKHNEDECIKKSLEKYKEFFFSQFIDINSGEVYNTINHDNINYRLYNYSWAIMFLVDLYELEENDSYLDIMVRAIKRFYKDGGSKFYPNGWFLLETVDVLKKSGKNADEILKLYREHINNMVKIGTSYPPHEVNYEQTIVTPGATMITQYMLATQSDDFLQDSKKQIDILSRFNGNQPDYHLYETAIRHWDDYWFGKSRLYGDTFPHYWSSLTGLAYLNYYKLTHNEDYLKKAEDNLRNCLCLFYPDGGASCAYVYPYSVNGVKGGFYDDWANDQDFALYYNLKYHL
jgi:hypothetical protein